MVRKIKSYTLLVAAFYRSHVSDEINLRKFYQFLKGASTSNAHIINAGDFNSTAFDWMTERL